MYDNPTDLNEVVLLEEYHLKYRLSHTTINKIMSIPESPLFHSSHTFNVFRKEKNKFQNIHEFRKTI